MKLLKKWYDKFIKDLAKSNEETYGDKKLDCCGLNSKKHKNSIHNKK